MTTVNIIDATGRRQDVTALLVSFDGVVRHLKGGEWSCELNASVWDAVRAAWPGTDAEPLVLVVAETDGVVISGLIETATYDRSGGVPKVTLTGGDEHAGLLDRLVYPQPADAPPWNTDVYDTVSGQASTAAADLIRNHAGDLARAERQMVGLEVVDQAAGDTGTWTYRLRDVAAAVQAIATETDLAVDVRRQFDGTVVVTVGATRVRTNLVLDDTKLTNFSLVLSRPTATTVIAAGTGTGTSRLFAIAGDQVTGRARREILSDQRNIGSLPELQRSARATRAASSASTMLSGELTADAAAAYRWRRHYDLGDIIRLRAFGALWDVSVSAVTVKGDPGGWKVAPVLGIAPRDPRVRIFKDIAGLADRVNNVEVA